MSMIWNLSWICTRRWTTNLTVNITNLIVLFAGSESYKDGEPPAKRSRAITKLDARRVLYY
jgi:hypothetical protein